MNLKVDIRNTKAISIFKKLILSKTYGNSSFSVYDPLGEKLLTRLRLKFSHRKEQKLRHGFADTINPMHAAKWTLNLQNTFFNVVTFILLKDLNSSIIFRELTQIFKICLIETKFHLLYGSKTNTSENFNQNVIKIIIKYLNETGRFENSLLHLKLMKLVFLNLILYFNIFL